MGAPVDISGQRFTRLVAVERVGLSKHNDVLWKCVCDCGKETISTVGMLRSKNTQSCGCLQAQRRQENILKHGFRYTPEYGAYCRAKSRCTNLNHIDRKFYGGRGIKFMFTSFVEFREHIGLKPSPKHSLDRIDVDGNYEIGNVRWATHSEQIRNRRHFHRPVIQIDLAKADNLRSKGFTYEEIATEIGVSPSTISSRLKDRGKLVCAKCV